MASCWDPMAAWSPRARRPTTSRTMSLCWSCTPGFRRAALPRAHLAPRPPADDRRHDRQVHDPGCRRMARMKGRDLVPLLQQPDNPQFSDGPRRRAVLLQPAHGARSRLHEVLLRDGAQQVGRPRPTSSPPSNLSHQLVTARGNPLDHRRAATASPGTSRSAATTRPGRSTNCAPRTTSSSTICRPIPTRS